MKRAAIAFALCLGLLIPISLLPVTAEADTVDTIKEQIQKINEERAKLDAEIAGYQKELNAISGTKQTLQ